MLAVRFAAAAVLSLSIAPASLSAQARTPEAVPAGWVTATRAFDSLLTADSVAGGALIVVRQGRVVARHMAGYQDRVARIPVSERTIYHWGSITKTLTAVAILQLRDRGMLSLDDPITRWVPELRQVHDPYGPVDAITLRMLLSHSAGFQNPTWPYRKYESWEPFEPTRWEQLVAMMPYQEVHFQPGSRFSYSNPGYIYLARVIEAITGDPWQSYIYKNLWSPLEIRRSYFNATPWHLADARSNNYTLVRDSAGAERLVDNGRDFNPGVTIPNGGWNAPIDDLAQWVTFLSGATGGDAARSRLFDTVLRRETLAEMWRPIVPVAPGSAEAVGLGFFTMDLGGAQLIGHTGEQAGFRSWFYLNPATGTAVIACVNTTNEARPEASGTAFRRALDASVRMLLP